MAHPGPRGLMEVQYGTWGLFGSVTLILFCGAISNKAHVVPIWRMWDQLVQSGVLGENGVCLGPMGGQHVVLWSNTVYIGSWGGANVADGGPPLAYGGLNMACPIGVRNDLWGAIWLTGGQY
jgi:hypothetical protein